MKKNTFVTILFFFCIAALSYAVIFALQHGNALYYWKILSFSLFLFLIPLILTFQFMMSPWRIAFLGGVFTVLSFLSYWASGSLYFLIPIVPYIVLSGGFLALNRRLSTAALDSEIVIEKNLMEQNELQQAYEERLRRSRALQSKYLTYYNLRKSIEDLSAQLSIENLSRLIVAEAYEFLKKGDRALLLLGSPNGSQLTVAATRSLDSEAKISYRDGDYFDYWTFKNRQPLLINDLEKDFRFNVERETLRESFESTMIVPLSLESEGGGLLRINSSKKNAFTIEDMRALQILSDLASTALLNSYLYSKTEELAIRDSLTGLYVQRYFKERLKDECQRAASKKGHVFTLLLLDLDHFKQFNDQYGHTAGDIALSEIGGYLQREIGAQGFVARYGGEEFAIILFDKGKVGGLAAAESLRQGIEQFPIKIREKTHRFTISCGLAEFSGTDLNADKLIHLTDQALYEAKNTGRNRVCSRT